MSARNSFQGRATPAQAEALNAAGATPLAPAATSLADDEWVRLLTEADAHGRTDWAATVQARARRRARIQLIAELMIVAGAIVLALFGGLC